MDVLLLLGCCLGLSAAVIFCLGLAPAYNSFGVVSAGGVAVTKFPNFAQVKYLKIII